MGEGNQRNNQKVVVKLGHLYIYYQTQETWSIAARMKKKEGKTDKSAHADKNKSLAQRAFLLDY